MPRLRYELLAVLIANCVAWTLLIHKLMGA